MMRRTLDGLILWSAATIAINHDSLSNRVIFVIDVLYTVKPSDRSITYNYKYPIILSSVYTSIHTGNKFDVPLSIVLQNLFGAVLIDYHTIEVLCSHYLM